jgi:succinate dehydrogenase / fumarate reductase iron-sulfur subunit
MQVTFDVYRKDPEPGSTPYRSNYELDLPDDATITDGLLKIRDEIDGTLSFRASCGRGYCGECLTNISRRNRLACTTRVSAFASGPIALNPVRIVPVIKDLVFDWDAFMWNKIKALQPWMEARDGSESETIVSDSDMKQVRQAMSCFYCGLCDEGCTALPEDFNFLGPAALTKASRFVFDPRDTQTRDRLRVLERPKGIWDCVHCFGASEHCPRGIEPTERIVAMRDLAYKRGITNERVARHHMSFAASVKETGWVDEGRLAIESEGYTNVSGLMRLLPTAVKATMRGKAPLPFIHAKRPGADRIKRIFEKGEQKP